MKRTIPLFLTLLFATGCLKSVELNDSGKYACRTDDDCLNGMTCHLNEFSEKKCFIVNPQGDAKQPDTAVADLDDGVTPGCQLQKPAPENACTNSVDQGVINGFVSPNHAVVSCLASTSNGDAMVLACSCFHPEKGLSVPCSTCFGYYAACVNEKCNDPCNPLKGGQPQSTDCKDCVANSGCEAPFKTCSGLP